MSGTAECFADQLRRWRALRRLSQLDLADAASTTQRHLSFLESGRSRPKAEIVLRLGTALDLSLREQNELLASAGYTAAHTESPLDGDALDTILPVLQHVVDAHMPYPAILTKTPGIALAGNPAMNMLYDGVEPELLVPPVNVYRLALHPAGLARRIENFPVWATHVVRAVESRAARHPSPELNDLADELRRYLPEEQQSQPLGGSVTPMQLTTAMGTITLLTTRTVIANASDVTLDELEIEAFLPNDTASRDRLLSLLEMTG